MGYLLLSMLLIVIGATVASGWVVYFILSAAGVGRVWRMGLSWIASMLPVSLAVTTSGSPFLSGDVLVSSLAFSGFWVILLLFLEWRRGRKAIPD
jgi:xanthine/uracil/vitamin C permease (AzgA family)